MYAQQRTVSGTVLDAQQQPIIGAAVMLAGGGNVGSVTDLDGKFAVNVPNGSVTLDVTCLGYISQQVVVSDSQSTVTITLAEDAMLIEETVVVGYGTQKKVNLTGAISVVDEESLKVWR